MFQRPCQTNVITQLPLHLLYKYNTISYIMNRASRNSGLLPKCKISS